MVAHNGQTLAAVLVFIIVSLAREAELKTNVQINTADQ
jgi:hypothetical protein